MIRGAIDRFKDFLKQAYPNYQNHIKEHELRVNAQGVNNGINTGTNQSI